MRLDIYLTENGYCESRNKACALIRDGKVTVDGVTIKKSSYNTKDSSIVEIDSSCHQYVSRSATKLITAIKMFNLDFSQKVAIDLGASTGGFCEVMLEHNVSKIFAIDIGTNQLHEKIKANPKVIAKENTNARYISKDNFNCDIDIITCDLSFISLKHILQPVYDILKTGGEFICLVKPQFEVGKSHINKNGVVKDKRAQIMCINEIVNFAIDIGFSVYDICFSGLEGESGNREFLLHIKKDEKVFKLDPFKISNAVLGSDK